MWAPETEHRLGDRQDNYQQQFSAQYCLVLIPRDMFLNRRNKHPKYLIAFDIPEAFDFVPYSTALQQLLHAKPEAERSDCLKVS